MKKFNGIKYDSMIKSIIDIVVYFRVAMYQNNTRLLINMAIEFFFPFNSSIVNGSEPSIHLDAYQGCEVSNNGWCGPSFSKH